MKNSSSTLALAFILAAGLAILSAGCGSNTTAPIEESDSLQTEAQNEELNEQSAAPKLLVLVPGALEIGIPEGVNEIERKKGEAEDSLFFEVAMGINVMDLDFDVFKCTDENMALEQMEEQALFVSDEGKTFEHESGKKYRSQWYSLPYFTDNKFSLTSYKREDDYSTLEDDAKANSNNGLTENQILSAHTNRYYLRFITKEDGKPRVFVMVLNLTVGC
jgi:hypothetical protein